MNGVNSVIGAFWRAAAYCLHPRVMLVSLIPVLLAGAAVLGFGWWLWTPAVDTLRQALEAWWPSAAAFDWLQSVGAGGLRGLVAPLLIIAVAVPLVVVVTLLLVALLMAPAIIELVARRRFPALERRRGAGPWQTALWSLAFSALALLLMLVSLPLWLLPPLGLVLPALLWGWLAYRVFAFEVLAGHASADERRILLREHRGPLLVMGMLSGAMGAAPALLLFVSATPMALLFAPVLLVLAVWLYTLVFGFAAAWFAHYELAALEELRADEALRQTPTPGPPPAGPAAAVHRRDDWPLPAPPPRPSAPPSAEAGR
ncbi:MAG: EI24 domain-containing protein [Rubrivivax sp.]